MNVDVDGLRAAAELLPDDAFEHKGDCGGSMCAGCGHCCHSIAKCDHQCDPGGGCSTAIDTDELRFRRDVVAALDRLQAAEAAVGRLEQRVADSGFDPLDALRSDRGPGEHERQGYLDGLRTAARIVRAALDGTQDAAEADLRASEPQDDHPCYSDALRWAADVAHSEARWQWERDLRRITGAQIVAQRAEVLEACYREAADRHDKQASGAESDHGDRREGEGLA